MMWQGLVIFLLLILGAIIPSPGEAKHGQVKGGEEVGRLVLRYAEALSHSNIEAFAVVDLGCLTRQWIQAGGAPRPLSAETAQQCWNETLNAHAEMVAQEAETGVFGAVGQGVGFGMLHDRHRATETWKEYPPALFVSPAVVRRDHGPAPQLTLVRVSPVQPIALTGLAGPDPVGLKGQAADVKVVYTDPLTAPLALRPEEVWWVSGAQRRFGPVREVVARFVVVSGLRKFGYPVDQAVINEALSDAPRIPTAHYGMRPEAGRVFEQLFADSPQRLLKGELVMGSARWWERTEAKAQFHDALQQASRLSGSDRAGLLSRLLLLDPTDPEANGLRGDDAYLAFLQQGVAKGGLAARDEATLWCLAELYWTLQAQTWRQELTAVAEGHEPAADALYKAVGAYDALSSQGRANAEQRRRLGALNRWNNDPALALAIHERLLTETPPNSPHYGRVLTEIAWDRIQWVSWERRYDHPWLVQASAEATQAAALVEQPHDKLMADYALVVVEALTFPRNLAALQQRLQQVKQDLDNIPGAKGLWSHLVANELVKALMPQSQTVMLPTPARSLEVLDVAIHATPPRQEIVWQWDFDQDTPQALPSGFVAISTAGAEAPDWQVLADGEAPTPGQLVAQTRPCLTSGCAHLLVADRVRARYPDVVVQIKDVSSDGPGEAGIALAVLDSENYYAITLKPSTSVVTTRRVSNGQTTVLGEVPVKLAARPWHTLRVQRVNFIHLDKGRLGVFIDGAQVAAVDDAVLPQEGRIGLITFGRTAAKFDGFHILDLVSNRPLSGPAAY